MSSTQYPGRWTWATLITIAIAIPASGQAFEPDEVGRIVLKSNQFGSYHQYVPQSKPPEDLAVIVHGRLRRKDLAVGTSREYAERWVVAAEEHGAIIIAPVFDEENFGGVYGPGGGYRGLWGRQIGADEFVNRIVSRYFIEMPELNSRFRLYGHGAGGQFACRYTVRHPHRIRSVTISCAEEYAFPDPDVQWKYGMAPMTRMMRWKGEKVGKRVRVTPDPAGWTVASALPISLVVGALADEPRSSIPGHPQNGGYVTLARGWAKAMQSLARKNGLAPGVRAVIVPSMENNGGNLTAVSIRELFERSADVDRDNVIQVVNIET